MTFDHPCPCWVCGRGGRTHLPLSQMGKGVSLQVVVGSWLWTRIRCEEGCQLNEEGYQLSEEGCQLSKEGCQLSEEGCQLSEEGCQLSKEGCQLSEEGCRAN